MYIQKYIQYTVEKECIACLMFGVQYIQNVYWFVNKQNNEIFYYFTVPGF